MQDQDSQPTVIPESRYDSEYSEIWQQDVFCVTTSQGEKFYLHTANITIEGDEFSSLSFRRQIRRGAQARLPQGYRVIEATNGIPTVQWDHQAAEAVDVDDYSLDI